MGLSIAISGGIVLTVFVLLLFSLPGLADKMFSIGDISSKVSEFDQKIANTDISLETLFATSGSPYVNFTLNNDDQEKLWNFGKFNVIVEYESPSGDELEELSFSGECLGAVPAVGDWCIEQISGDFIDKGILNNGESAEIWTRVSQNLASGNARITVSTDNGEIAMLPAPKRSWFDASPIPPATCEFEVYGRTFVDTDTGLTFVCDPTRDKWLSVETIVLFGEQSVTENDCDNNNDPTTDSGCNVDWGAGLGPNDEFNNTPPELGLYVPYDATIIAVGFSAEDGECSNGSFDLELWSTADNTVDEPYTLDQEIASGISNTQVYNDNLLNVDINGDRYTIWGIDNNCVGGNNDFENWNMIIYLKWRHDNP